MQTIYVEQQCLSHPRTKAILARFPGKEVITCNHYGEIFNRHKQNFRTQKENPALIIAMKTGKKVLPTPPGFGIGGQRNYYFSHLLNCPFDCRYCFLQGMYRSAHYVLFINYEDFISDIQKTIDESEQRTYFFSGYDADSLAYDPVSQFTQSFIPYFNQTEVNNKAYLELRTKSANIRPLLKLTGSRNIIAAFSINPENIVLAHEKKTASLAKRIEAMQRLADHGYSIGLRMDPLIWTSNFKQDYQRCIDNIFKQLDNKAIHSVSIGVMRFPEKMLKKMRRLHPQDPLLNQPLTKQAKIISYPDEQQNQMRETVKKLLTKHVTEEKIFSCGG
jgi:spore photoproduct lyase